MLHGVCPAFFRDSLPRLAVWTIECPFQEIVERAHSRHVVGVEAAKHGVEGIGAQSAPPFVYASDPEKGHEEKSAKHAEAVAGFPPDRRAIAGLQYRPDRIEVEGNEDRSLRSCETGGQSRTTGAFR